MSEEEARQHLEEAIEQYARVVNESNDTLHAYILSVVTSNITDLSRNWHSEIIVPKWQPYFATLGLVEYQYMSFNREPDDDD